MKTESKSNDTIRKVKKSDEGVERQKDKKGRRTKRDFEKFKT